MIPVFDAEGEVVEIYGRKIGDESPQGHGATTSTCPARTAASSTSPPCGASKEIILCEALIDALTFWCAGFRNVTSAYGTNGFTDEMLEAYAAYGVERVLIAFDRDEAGDKAATKLAERLGGEGISCFRVRFPRGMDANDYALKVQPAGAVARRAAALGRAHGRTSADPLRDSDPARLNELLEITIDEPHLPLAAAPSPEAKVMTEETPASAARRRLGSPRRLLTTAPPPRRPGGDRRSTRSSSSSATAAGESAAWPETSASSSSRSTCSSARGERFHVDSLDLYSARQRGVFVRQASTELQLKRRWSSGTSARCS